MRHDQQPDNAPDPVIVVSPHLDDAVLSCGSLLAAHGGSTVVTVFSGFPSRQRCTAWDAASGFRTSTEAVAARRDEDRAALDLLGAHPVWLDFADGQYCEPTDPDAVVESLEEQVPDGARLFGPLGLLHGDHRLVGRAYEELCRRLVTRRVACHVYAESPYRAVDHGRAVRERRAQLEAAGFVLTRMIVPRGSSVRRQKFAAAMRYDSQWLALRHAEGVDLADVARPETLWLLAFDDTTCRGR